MCVRILMNEKQIDSHEWHHFLAGGSPKSVRNSLNTTFIYILNLNQMRKIAQSCLLVITFQ